MTKTAKDAATAGRRRDRASKGRSGGVVDAPGKKHRKPMPNDPRAVAADAKRVDHAIGQGVDEDDEDARARLADGRGGLGLTA